MSNYYYYYFNNIIDKMNIRFSCPKVNEGRKIFCPFSLLTKENTMKLYCGTYKKYNEGSLFGAWMDLDDYEDAEEFTKACLEIHKDEKDPELMFQDYEADYEWEAKLHKGG